MTRVFPEVKGGSSMQRHRLTAHCAVLYQVGVWYETIRSVDFLRQSFSWIAHELARAQSSHSLAWASTRAAIPWRPAVFLISYLKQRLTEVFVHRNDEWKAHPPTILIGQFDSPFDRRVGIARRLYDLPFEHRPWSTFGDAEKIAPFNPLRRVPALVLEGGDALIEHGDSRLFEPSRRAGKSADSGALSGAAPAVADSAPASGLSDEVGSLLYERVLRKDQLALWVERCEVQIGDSLALLERERAAVASSFWFGPRVGHADIAVACVLCLTVEAHPGLFGAVRYPGLAALPQPGRRCRLFANFRRSSTRRRGDKQ